MGEKFTEIGSLGQVSSALRAKLHFSAIDVRFVFQVFGHSAIVDSRRPQARLNCFELVVFQLG